MKFLWNLIKRHGEVRSLISESMSLRKEAENDRLVIVTGIKIPVSEERDVKRDLKLLDSERMPKIDKARQIRRKDDSPRYIRYHELSLGGDSYIGICRNQLCGNPLDPEQIYRDLAEASTDFPEARTYIIPLPKHILPQTILR